MNMRQVGIGLLVLMVIALIAHRVLMPFTPGWVDIAFIGVCALLLILMRLVKRNGASDGAHQPSDKE
jgi:hypothetical protein